MSYRVPVVYNATEIVNWHIAEEFAPGKWRPARCLGFYGLRYLLMRIRIAWRVFNGTLDALNWGDSSGEKGRRFKDCTEPEFFTAINIHEREKGRSGR